MQADWARDYQARYQASLQHPERNSARNAVQEQLDWVTANMRGAAGGAASGVAVSTDFAWDPSTSLYYSQQRRMYYNPNTAVYYNTVTGAYSRWDNERQLFIAVSDPSAAATAPPASAPKDVAKATAVEAEKQMKAAESAVEAALKATPVAVVDEKKASTRPVTGGAVKFSIGKKMNKDMLRWKQKHKQLDAEVKHEQDVAQQIREKAPPRGISAVNRAALLASVEASAVSSARPSTPQSLQPPPLPNQQQQQQQPKAQALSQHGVRTRVYVSEEKITCLLCQRQFKTVEKLHKHELHSELHRTNMQLDDYEKVRRIEQSARLVDLNLAPTKVARPKKKSKKRLVARESTLLIGSFVLLVLLIDSRLFCCPRKDFRAWQGRCDDAGCTRSARGREGDAR